MSVHVLQNGIERRKAEELRVRAEEILAVQKGEELLDESYQYNWGHDMIITFEETLGLKSYDRSKEPCPFSKHVVSTLTYPEQTLESYIWTYFSLYSLNSLDYLKPTLTTKIYNLLIKLFDKVEVPVINSVPRKCFELENSIILGYFDQITNVEPVTTPFLLEENAMWFKEVVKLNKKDLRTIFR